MKIYLDMCCFNRPYDDQTQSRIRIETEAKIVIQQKIKDGEHGLLWSSILDFECSKNPFLEHRIAILKWRNIASTVIMIDDSIIARATNLMKLGVHKYDALHVACSIASGAELFVTTDDRLLKYLRVADDTLALLPQNALAYMENWYEN
ncbi:PIN domain protein [Methylomonas lenta]|uniref:PIN domain protein n=1 Tax=Methylomonas lenta TaxID=980561 RepID=A0A177N8X9_9GAMM|nr:PIN domain-containing protein [Methylomonas lenta]OAI14478.1 PIN domain protein [Methylomonas lenta]